MSDNTQKFLFVGLLLLTTSFIGTHPLSGVPRPDIPARPPPRTPPLFVLSSEPTVLPSISTVTRNVGVAAAQVFLPPPPPPPPYRVTAQIISPYLQDSPPLPPSKETSVPPLGVPTVKAAAALVFNADTSERYLNAGEEKRWPLASLTKLMTAAVALDLIKKEMPIEITGQDYAVSNLVEDIKVGDRYRALDLVRAMLTVSSNVAAEALARTYGRADFIAAMNHTAEAWGLRETYFDDPSGLSIANQSTPADLEKLVVRLRSEHPDVLAITREPVWRILELTSGRMRSIRNINVFAGKSDFLGGKTGYTLEAAGNLISLFSYNGKSFGIIVLGTNDRFGETERLLGWIEQTL